MKPLQHSIGARIKPKKKFNRNEKPLKSCQPYFLWKYFLPIKSSYRRMEYKDELSLVLGEQKKQKRPPNGYILYCLEKRTELRGLHPDLPNVQISRMLGDNWKALDESERRPYKEKAKALQADFKQKCPDYKYEKARERRLAQEMAIQNRNQAHSNEILQSDLETLLSFMKASNYFQQNQQTQPVQNVSVPGMSTGLSEPQYNMTNDFHPFGQIDFFDQR